MITFRDPPPLPLRVQAVRLPAATRSARPAAAWRFWVAGAFGVALFATVGVRLQRQQELIDALGPALSNTNVAQTERLLLDQLSIGTPIARVAQQLDAARVVCRRATPSLGGDSALVCLGRAQLRANVYTQMVLRLAHRAARLVTVDACPALLHWSRATLPARLEPRSADDGRCWRDASNIADNAWTYAVLPDAPFTVALLHAADTVTRRDDPTRDTLMVRW